MKRVLFVLVTCALLTCAAVTSAQTPMTTDQKVKLTVTGQSASGTPMPIPMDTMMVWSVVCPTSPCGTLSMANVVDEYSIWYTPTSTGTHEVRVSMDIGGLGSLLSASATVTVTIGASSVPASVAIVVGTPVNK